MHSKTHPEKVKCNRFTVREKISTDFMVQCTVYNGFLSQFWKSVVQNMPFKANI